MAGTAAGLITQVLAQCAVTDLDRARAWYDTLLGRAPDAPMAGLLEYHLTDGGGLQLWREPEHAGHATVVLSTTRLDATAERLREQGLTSAEVGDISAGRALQLADPDGNRVVLVGS